MYDRPGYYLTNLNFQIPIQIRDRQHVLSVYKKIQNNIKIL